VAERLRIVPLTDDLVHDAGRLVAERHRDERARHPILTARLEDTAEAAQLVAATCSYSTALAALDGEDRLAGFLSSWTNVPQPTSTAARFSPVRSSMFVVQGHAVRAHADPYRTYQALFAAHAQRLLDDDPPCTDHVAHVPAPALDAWADFGFGRAHAFAVRDLAPVDAHARDIEIRQATPDDLDLVEALVDEESRYHATSPILRPYLGEQTRDALRAELLASLEDEQTGVLLAGDVGVLRIGRPFGSPLYVPDGAAYISETAVVPSARNRGIGTALLARAIDWAHEHEHRALVLHYATTNVLSSSFWPGQGFTPVLWHVRRTLDDRITTMRPTAP